MLSPGVRVGPYEIVGPLGAGGMGEVYRARDTRLNRIVAVKVLSSDATVLQINQAGLRMLDATSKDELPSPIIQLVAPEHRDAFHAMAAKVLSGQGAQLQFEIIGLKGVRRWVETHAVRASYTGRPDSVIVAPKP